MKDNDGNLNGLGYTLIVVIVVAVIGNNCWVINVGYSKI